MTARDYLNELSQTSNQARSDKSEAGEKRSRRISRRWSLVHTAIRESVESADLLRGLTEILIDDWALPDDKVKTFKEAVSVKWHDAEDDKSNEQQARRYSRRWSLVHTAINEGVTSVQQLQNLIENLTHNWTLPDNKVKTFKEAVSVEWHDAEDQNKEILAKRMSRRWSLIHTAVNDGFDSVEDLQHLLLHLSHNWTLPKNKVKTFNEAVSVEWHDADDIKDSSAQQRSTEWSNIHSKIRNGCNSVERLQQELNLTTTDDIDGSYDDYEVDAKSLCGVSRRTSSLRVTARAADSVWLLPCTSGITASLFPEESSL